MSAAREQAQENYSRSGRSQCEEVRMFVEELETVFPDQRLNQFDRRFDLAGFHVFIRLMGHID
tara:strand:+ start:596 stop:784 length:189 start_codon:yes stop_codon:yes gene_type:complete